MLISALPPRAALLSSNLVFSAAPSPRRLWPRNPNPPGTQSSLGLCHVPQHCCIPQTSVPKVWCPQSTVSPKVQHPPGCSFRAQPTSPKQPFTRQYGATTTYCAGCTPAMVALKWCGDAGGCTAAQGGDSSLCFMQLPELPEIAMLGANVTHGDLSPHLGVLPRPGAPAVLLRAVPWLPFSGPCCSLHCWLLCWVLSGPCGDKLPAMGMRTHPKVGRNTAPK